VPKRDLLWKRSLAIGRDSDGNRITLEARLYETDGGETITHRKIVKALSLSITGEGTQPGKSDIEFGGQIVDSVRDVVMAKPTVDPSRLLRIAELWERWHLNDLKAGCIHQQEDEASIKAAAADDPARRAKLTSALLDLVEPCPVTDYEYGHAWLIEELPSEVIDEIKHLFR